MSDRLLGRVSIPIKCTQLEISFLREFRVRLIAEVVTGKLDVRAAVSELTEEIDSPDPMNDAAPLSEVEEVDILGVELSATQDDAEI